MSNDGKKITFSFSRVKKPALVKQVNTEPKEKIDYVDCFDGSKGKFSYKGNIKNDKIVKQELVIPMPSSKTSSDILKSKIQEKKSRNLVTSGTDEVGVKESEDSKANEHLSKNLEEMATLEILNDIKNDQVSNKAPSKLIIEAKNVPPEASELDIDYDNVPVSEFGLALLRGMGWRPDQGIGKEPSKCNKPKIMAVEKKHGPKLAKTTRKKKLQIIEAFSPTFRPKGLGLGAQLNTEIKNDEKKTKKDKDSNSTNISQKSKCKPK